MPCLLSSCRCKCTCNNTSILFSIFVVAALSFARSLVRSLLFSPSFFFYYFPFLSILVIILSLSSPTKTETVSFIFHIRSIFCSLLWAFRYFVIVSVIAPSTLTFTSIIICCCLVHFTRVFAYSFFHFSFQFSICELSFYMHFIFLLVSSSFSILNPIPLLALIRSRARSLFAFPSVIFFLQQFFLIPKQKRKARTETDRRRERERASYIFIPRWSIPHIKYSVFGAFLPFIIVIVCMVILS